MKKQVFIFEGNGTYLNRGCEAIARSTASILRAEFGSCTFINIPNYSWIISERISRNRSRCYTHTSGTTDKEIQQAMVFGPGSENCQVSKKKIVFV